MVKMVKISDQESDDDAVSEIFDELDEDISVGLSCRRETLHFFPKSTDWRNEILTSLDEERFKQMLRVTRSQFRFLHSILAKDPSFTWRQFSIELQLAIVLYRLGENVSLKKIANNFGIRDGGTISKITDRVFKVFLKLRPKVICWPSEKERSTIVSKTYNELPFCIGYIDGTEINLAEAPITIHTEYFSRNRVYAIKAQVVFDYKRKIRHVVIGSYGKFHDSKIYSESSIFTSKNQFFSSHQWIAGDSAYPLSEVLITPYRTTSKKMNSANKVQQAAQQISR